MKILRRSWINFRHWSRSRHIRFLLQGTPALLVAIFLLIIIFLAKRDADLQVNYRERAESAFAAQDYQTAALCYQRLMSADPRPETILRLAQISRREGEKDKSKKLMQMLAEKGHAEGLLWRAMQRLSSQNDGSQDLAIALLLKALDEGELQPNSRVNAHVLLGKCYADKKQFQKAQSHLRRIVDAMPRARLQLASVLRQEGKEDAAISEAKLVRKRFRRRCQFDPNDDLARSTWATAVAFMRDYPEAIQILKEGWQLTANPVFRKQAANVFLAWGSWLAKPKQPGEDRAELLESTFGTRLTLWEKGLSYDPTNKALLNRMLQATRLGEKQSAQVREHLVKLRKTLAKGEAVAPIHFALGVEALQRRERVKVVAEAVGDVCSLFSLQLHQHQRKLANRAILHLERAHENARHLSVAANNLAVLLADQPDPDYERALLLANAALKQNPQSKEILDTRGRIYAKMERWEEALADLTKVLPTYRDSPTFHAVLAQVYENLELTELAAEHTRLAIEKADQQKQRQKKLAS